MNKIKISRSRPVFKYLAIIIALFCLYIMIMYRHNMGALLVAGVISIISLTAGYQEYYAMTVEFDDENLYLSNKKFSGQISLNQIVAIRLTSNRVNQSHYWDVHYYDSSNGEHIFQILPKKKEFSLFMNKVKEKNPGVEINDSIFF